MGPIGLESESESEVGIGLWKEVWSLLRVESTVFKADLSWE